MSIDIDELRSIISEETGNPLNKIKPDSKLVSELGIDGDDGYELMELLANKYNVDLSNIDFYQYFGDESISPIYLIMSSILAWLAFFNLIPPGEYPDLTVNDLQQILLTAPSKGN
jgi:acyl carrier protein